MVAQILNPHPCPYTWQIFNGWWTGSFCGPSMDVVGPSWMMFPMICLGCHVYGWCINKEHNCWSEREGRILNCDGGGKLINYYNIQLFWSESCDVTEPWQSFAPNITMSVVRVWGGVGNWGDGKLSEKIIITIIFTSLLNFSS